jgi:hypothetical protein
MNRAFSARNYFCGGRPRAPPWAGMNKAFGLEAMGWPSNLQSERSQSQGWSGGSKMIFRVCMFGDDLNFQGEIVVVIGQGAELREKFMGCSWRGRTSHQNFPQAKGLPHTSPGRSPG